MTTEDICKYFLAAPGKKNKIQFGRRQVTFHKRETPGTEGGGGSERYVLVIVQLSPVGGLNIS